jgi:hypothetical protein
LRVCDFPVAIEPHDNNFTQCCQNHKAAAANSNTPSLSLTASRCAGEHRAQLDAASNDRLALADVTVNCNDSSALKALE